MVSEQKKDLHVNFTPTVTSFVTDGDRPVVGVLTGVLAGAGAGCAHITQRLFSQPRDAVRDPARNAQHVRRYKSGVQ